MKEDNYSDARNSSVNDGGRSDLFSRGGKRRRNRRHAQHSSLDAVWSSLFLIGIGVVLLFRNLELLILPSYVYTWKMLLIVLGIYNLLLRHWTFGLILTAIGTFFVLPEALEIPRLEFGKIWPAILILIGLSIFFRIIFPPRRKFIDFEMYSEESTIEITEENYMETTVIFSGAEKQISSYDFKGGKVTAIFGGAEIDLTNCHLSKENAIITITAVCGGLTLVVPRDWNIRSELVTIMGGYEDNARIKDTNGYIDPAAEIVLKGTLVMGGVEIKRG
jgi:predicted membrane protein